MIARNERETVETWLIVLEPRCLSNTERWLDQSLQHISCSVVRCILQIVEQRSSDKDRIKGYCVLGYIITTSKTLCLVQSLCTLSQCAIRHNRREKQQHRSIGPTSHFRPPLPLLKAQTVPQANTDLKNPYPTPETPKPGLVARFDKPRPQPLDVFRQPICRAWRNYYRHLLFVLSIFQTKFIPLIFAFMHGIVSVSSRILQ